MSPNEHRNYGVENIKAVSTKSVPSTHKEEITTVRVVALYQGFETEATPEGVAYATTRTVVISSLWVLGTDFVLTALMFSTP